MDICVGIIVMDGLALEIGSGIYSNVRWLVGGIYTKPIVTKMLERIAKGMMVRTVYVVHAFLKSILAHTKGKHQPQVRN